MDLNFTSMDDDPRKNFDFVDFKKNMSEMKSGNSSVGSILGAMVYQISLNKEKRHEDAMVKEEPPTLEGKKKMSSRAIKHRS